MFKRLLVPVTPDSIPARALSRAADIADQCGSTVTLLYITDPATKEIMAIASSYAIPVYDREYILDGLTLSQEERAKEIALGRARTYLGKVKITPNEVFAEGEFTKQIEKAAEAENMDVIFFDYSRDVLTKYKILDMPPVSDVWLDRGHEMNEILVLASNLAPNPMGAKYAAQLARIFRSVVTFCYIIDPTKKVESKRTLRIGKQQIRDFKVENPEIEVDSEIRQGPIEQVLPMVVDHFDPGLVIMPRFHKVKKRYFGLVAEDIKIELAKMLDTNILVVL